MGMMYGSSGTFGAKGFGRIGDIPPVARQCYGAALWGRPLYGWTEPLEAVQEIGIAIGCAGIGTTGYGVKESCGIQIGANGAAVVRLHATGSAGISIGCESDAVITRIAVDGAGIQIGCNGIGAILQIVSGSAGIKIGCIGYAGETETYSRVAARLVSEAAAVRMVTSAHASRIENSMTKGRF